MSNYKTMTSFSATLIFLIAIILHVNGLQDWWPALLKTWPGHVLYSDIHFYTGPLYPVLLKLSAALFGTPLAPKLLGIFATIFYVLSAFSMLDSMACRLTKTNNKPVQRTIQFALAAFILTTARYATNYLTPDDYHTITSGLYCLIINKIIIERSSYGPQNALSTIAIAFAKIPVSVLACIVLLNRTHEGILLLATLGIMHGISTLLNPSERTWNNIISKAGIPIISIGLTIGFLYFFQLTADTPSPLKAIKYVLVDAPASKGYAGLDYAERCIGIFMDAATTNIRYPIYLFITISIISNANALNALNALTYTTQSKKISAAATAITAAIIIYFAIKTLSKFSGHDGAIRALQSWTFLALAANAVIIAWTVVRHKELRAKVDLTILPASSLFGAHILSTQGLINESFLLYFIPGLLINASLLGIGIERLGVKIKTLMQWLMLALLILFSLTIILSKVNRPRSWWLTTEPSMLAERTWMLGMAFENAHPNVNPSLARIDSQLLSEVDKMCASIQSNNQQISLLSYPVDYFLSTCNTGSKKLTNYTNDFTYWYDVASPERLRELQLQLEQKTHLPDYIALSLNPTSLRISSIYYAGGKPYTEFIHYKFISSLTPLLASNYILQTRFYLINGRPTTTQRQDKLLDQLHQEGCFEPAALNMCDSRFSSAIGSNDVTFVGMYKHAMKP